MNQVALSLLVGLIAGLAGGYVGQALAPDPVPTITSGRGADDGTLAQRLERIETLLRGRATGAPLTLEGNLPPPDARPRVVRVELDEALLDALDERVSAAVKASVEEAFDASESFEADWAEPEKKKVTLAEVAAELSLSADEEAAVRRIAGETTEKVLALMVDEGQTVDDLKRELELAKDDPARQGVLLGKVMTKALTNLGGFISVGLEHDQKLRAAVGPEKADKLDDYEITDLDPYGLGSAFEPFGNSGR